MNVRRFPALLGLVPLWLVAGLPGLDPAAGPARYVVVPGDVIQLSVWAGGRSQEELTDTVTAARTIAHPMLGAVDVAGLGPPAIAERVREALAREYYVDPQVTAFVREFAGRVEVGGEVARPGRIVLRPGLTLSRACELAGGTTAFAAAGRVVVTRLRDGRPGRLQVDLARIRRGVDPDVALRDGDRIHVPQRWF